MQSHGAWPCRPRVRGGSGHAAHKATTRAGLGCGHGTELERDLGSAWARPGETRRPGMEAGINLQANGARSCGAMTSTSVDHGGAWHICEQSEARLRAVRGRAIHRDVKREQARN